MSDRSQMLEQVSREYEAFHKHPVNIAIHVVCVPLIILSFMGLFNLIPAPVPVGYAIPVIFIAYYAIVGPSFLPPALAMFVVLVALDQLLQRFAAPIYWQVHVAIFVVCWALQFWGHKLEGNKPAFLSNKESRIHSPFMAPVLSIRHGLGALKR